ncbi:MAG TPA: serpin family protein [Longimicrobiales bacterium]
MPNRRGTLRSFALLGALALAAALPACDLLTGPRTKSAPEPLTSLPRALSAGEQQVISGSNAFAFGLLRETARQDTSSNIFLSPLSASMALGMTMNGAQGETLAGMKGALGFGAVSLDQANQSYRSLIDLLLGLDSSVDMRLANSIWARQGFVFQQSFYDTVHRYFDAQVTSLDFSSPNAAPTINEWVKNATAGKIDQIVDSPIDDGLVMFLINAVYFKGTWRDKFDPDATRDAPFTLADGRTRTVKMMHRTGPGSSFAALDGTRGVELAYGRGAFVMDIVLPPAGSKLSGLVARLDTATWNGWMRGLHSGELDLSMPRYKLRWEDTLNEPLKRLGMQAAFSWPPADFRAMCKSRDDCYIDFVKQKTYVDVNEEGTEAAAVTSVGVGVTSAPLTVPFVVDRPFLVAIRERFSGSLLFLGAIGAPVSQ